MAVRTSEISRAEWSQALDQFSVVHEGWLISLDILSPDSGAQPGITDLPLVGATCEETNAATIIITAGRSAAQITRTIQAPHCVWIERTDGGSDAALGIESADGVMTILRLRTAALPETVDGIAPGPRRNPGGRTGNAR